MVQIRIYSAVTGQCLAGDRRVDYTEEQRRIQEDFSAGTKLAIDETNQEIRGFIPASRRSPEAFFAAVHFENVISLQVYAESIQKIFTTHDSWSIRWDTPEGQLLSIIAGRDSDAIQEITGAVTQSIDQINRDDLLKIGVENYSIAAAILHELQSESDVERHQITSVVSDTKTAQHIDWDVLLHVNSTYEQPTILTNSNQR